MHLFDPWTKAGVDSFCVPKRERAERAVAWLVLTSASGLRYVQHPATRIRSEEPVTGRYAGLS